MNNIIQVELAPARGRAMLAWDGKQPLHHVDVPAMQAVETFSTGTFSTGADPANAASNLLFDGDNKAALAWLLAHGWRGKVKLIYIDPPFDTGTAFARNVTLRGKAGAGLAVQKRAHALGRQAQYRDSWAADEYLQFIYERLFLLRELLSEDGSLWLHCDHRRAHYLRLLLEEVFGADNYLNTISWRSQTARGAKVNAFYFPFSTQYIEVFARNRAAPTTWNVVRKQIVLPEEQAAATYMRDERGFFRTSDPGSYSFDSLKALHAQGRLYAPYGGEVIVDEAGRRVYGSNGGNIGVKYYLKKLARNRYAVERAIDNLWDDIPGLGTTPGEDQGYPTQKTEALLRRIIAVSTHPGDVVLDCFIGSGTTAAVAQKMGRCWIGCDANPVAVQTTVRRLQWVMARQAAHADAFMCARQFALYRAGARGAQDAQRVPAAAEPREESRARIAVERGLFDSTGMPLIQVSIESFAAPALDRPLGDWRAAVDSVMIDPAYDGKVFNVVLSDVPQKRSELVAGRYTLPAPEGETVVAVRITDVWGGELFVTQRV